MSKPAINRQHILIIGAGPGLSTSIARRFGREGYAVTLVARNEQNLSTLAGQLRLGIEPGRTGWTAYAHGLVPRGENLVGRRGLADFAANLIAPGYLRTLAARFRN